VKKFFFLWVAALFLYSCTSSDPRIYDYSISDSTPVTGEKVLMQVSSLSDHYPMTYNWTCDGGTLDVQEESSDNFIYWNAPDEAPGTYHVTCRVVDENDHATVQDFTLVVSTRDVEVLYSTDTNATTALSIEQESYSIIGGIWASLSNAEVHYITSTSDALTSTWTGAFSAMTIIYDFISGNHALWGAYNQDFSDFDGNIIALQSTTATSSLTCPYDSGTDVINALIVSYENPGYYLMVGSDSGLYWYHTDSETEQWHNYSADYGIGKTYSFALTPDGLTGYAATDKGIYSFDFAFFTLSTTPIYESNINLAGKASCAVTVDNDGAIWHVTDGNVYKGETLMTPPGEIACTLAVDTNGHVWCGKYYWGDDAAWHTPAVLAPFTISKVAGSNEGRMYFITDSGALLRY
jgi:hypothetical protein